MIFQGVKCSEQTSVPAAIVYSLPSSQRIPWIHYFPLDADVGQFLSLLVTLKNTKTSRHSEMKQTRPSTKQDFSGEAKQNIEASLASLSWNSSRAMTEWSAIFAFGVWTNQFNLNAEGSFAIRFTCSLAYSLLSPCMAVSMDSLSVIRC